ncbi:hypothetical protein AXF42_Ash006127 [Apostasia shenzhenica]|uniref:Uncharacterized protein n=1 Tax=Apostasia shenzhenica TaxID=1088818 RepID=A0A2I0B0B9_9ASPA|nr:hypothetical protein AXF42_Ash006127 [Apostasia shenzhenica]
MGNSAPGWFKRLRRRRSCQWQLKLSISRSWRWLRLSLGFSVVEDVAFRVISVLEAVALLASISCFFLCCGCRV